ncbi:MAG: restriction endonuclease [Nitrospira sp.]|nr:MAG: restriction endonuclease [Nitrospira sp.]
MIPKHISRASDLVTSHQAVCIGFLNQALTKTQKATPYVKEAFSFWQVLQGVSEVSELLQLPEYRDHLLASAGFSDKAMNHLSESELEQALQRVFETILQRSGEHFREEVFFRYLLTKGDALGGQMHNVTGAAGQTRLMEAIQAALKRAGAEYDIVHAANGEKIQRISWDSRRLLFDVKPKLIDKSIDVILLDTSSNEDEEMLLERAAAYLACGELKGGIDPAGADEHWKTAKTALSRIRNKLKRSCPPLFFVAAAIEMAMAKEIFRDLKKGFLTHIANLTDDRQVEDLASWLVSL